MHCAQCQINIQRAIKKKKKKKCHCTSLSWFWFLYGGPRAGAGAGAWAGSESTTFDSPTLNRQVFWHVLGNEKTKLQSAIVALKKQVDRAAKTFGFAVDSEEMENNPAAFRDALC